MENANYGLVKDLKGVGKKLTETFNKQEIITIKDLFLNLPKRYVEYKPQRLSELVHDSKCCLVGKIVTPLKFIRYKEHFTGITFSIEVENQVLKTLIFNREYLLKLLKPGMYVKISGKYNLYRQEVLISEIFLDTLKVHIETFYKTKDVSSKMLLKLVKEAYSLGYKLDEYLPKVIMDKYHFLEINEMVKTLHEPLNLEMLNLAKKRKKYEEILEFYLRLAYFENLKEKALRDPINYDILKVKELIKTIGFELTEDQKLVTNEIFKDFKKPNPANRLIEGDVGSGKTIVALIASYAVVTAHKQVIMMVPTEILASQQVTYFKNYLEKFNVKVGLLTASLKKPEREKVLKEVSEGKIDILIGTHALYYEKINYHDLGLAIIDEQHRFGVNARNSLLDNGKAIDAIYLSATPIPRTLGLTLFSDLDLSIIKSKRENKKEIFTKVLTLEHFDFVLKHLKSELAKGHQAYFVTSAIENLDMSLRFDLEEVKNLILKSLPNAKIGILHGKMKENEKQKVMQAFINKELDIIVSTTVIEVGISVDNATIICIMDAQNFGLSQLHQLRGRVGRANLNGACYLVTNNLDIKRLQALEQISDGFNLAEMDLELRGPGDYFGMRQSGFSEFVFADFKNDQALFKEIQQDARSLSKLKSQDVKDYLAKVVSNLSANDKLN